MAAQGPQDTVTDNTESDVAVPRLDDLISKATGPVIELDGVSVEASALLAEVPEERRRHTENLLHYAHLRTIDIRELQNGLHDLGVTSLTTVETFTRGRLELALNALLTLAGCTSDIDVAYIIVDDEHADVILDSNATELFGQEHADATSHIMVALPAEAADDAKLVKSFVAAGMGPARINCAHDSPEQWSRMIDSVSAVAEKIDHRISASMDLAGPKLRTGDIEPGPHVGHARVMCDGAGTVISKSKIQLTPRLDEHPKPAPNGLPERPALPLQASQGWSEQSQLDDTITLHGSRSTKRHFTVVRIDTDADGEIEAVLAEGEKDAWIAEGTHLYSDYEVTRASGVPSAVQRLRFHTGDEFTLTSREEVTTTPYADDEVPRVSCSLPSTVAAPEPGGLVLFDDDALGAEVAEVPETSSGGDSHVDARLHVQRTEPNEQPLAMHKEINPPNTDLPPSSLTDEDIEHLRFMVEHAGIVAMSPIRTQEDAEYVYKVLDEIMAEHEAAGREGLVSRTRDLGVMLKIETIPAFQNLPGIIIAGMKRAKSDLMIARGDLAVELGFDRVDEVPGQILTLAQAAEVPTILSTQVLKDMAKAGLPSRAEITDAAFTPYAECVMLNEGPHITETIAILSNLTRKVGHSQRKNRIMLRKIRSWSD